MILMANERCYVGHVITCMAIYSYPLAFKDITHVHVITCMAIWTSYELGV